MVLRRSAFPLIAGLLAALGLGALGLAAPSAAPASGRSPKAPVHRRHRAPGRRHAPAKLPGPPVFVVQTTAGLGQALKVVAAGNFAPPSRGPQPPVIHIDDTQRYQALTGYGAAMTDSSAWLLQALGGTARDRVMQGLFGARGLRINFVRLPMGGSDFTVGRTGYSYDEMPPGQSDQALQGFSIGHDLAYIVPALHEMLAIDPFVEILGSPWSPPTWMKANHAFDDQGSGGYLLPGMEAPLAGYFVRFVQAYAAQGIRIADLTPENEPLSTAIFPAARLPADQEADFVQNYLRPALSAAGLDPGIWGDDGADLAYATALEQSPAAGQFAGMAWHCYYGANLSINAFHATYPGVANIVSECSPGINPYSVSELFIDATRNWASKIQLWNLALDPSGGPVQPPDSGCGGCTGLVTINPTTGSATYTANYFRFGQISKFVDPGAVRVYSDRFVQDFNAGGFLYGVTSAVDNVAFLNPDGSHVLVAYNNADSAQRFALAWHARRFAYRLPGHATATFLWR